MEFPLKMVIILCLTKLALLEPVPDLVRGRTMEDVKGAEFWALDTIGLIQQWGYPAEEHVVVTEDGYILIIHRIPFSPKLQNNTVNRQVIFLQCGMTASSEVWAALGIERSLAAQLSDEGYDVWMGNYRGSTYGREHVTLSPDDRKFWDFSHHEMGIFDLPNMIDYVLEFTNQSSLTYLGHSLGSTTILITLSERPEFNEKINLFIALAPVAIWEKKTALRELSAIAGHLFQNIFEPNGTIEFIPQSSVFAAFFKRICMKNGLMDFCLLPFDLLVGTDHYQLDMEKLIPYLCHYPSGSSAKVFYHYLQSMKTGKFRQWDYENEAENMRHYERSEPPEYNLANVKSPMLIFWGKNDPLATITDIRELMRRVSSKSISEAVKFKHFNHVDFVMAKEAKKLIYDLVVERLNQFHERKIAFLHTEKNKI